jgi:hypothetical protein
MRRARMWRRAGSRSSVMDSRVEGGAGDEAAVAGVVGRGVVWGDARDLDGDENESISGVAGVVDAVEGRGWVPDPTKELAQRSKSAATPVPLSMSSTKRSTSLAEVGPPRLAREGRGGDLIAGTLLGLAYGLISSSCSRLATEDGRVRSSGVCTSELEVGVLKRSRFRLSSSAKIVSFHDDVTSLKRLKVANDASSSARAYSAELE